MKNEKFGAYSWLCLCLFFSTTEACRIQKPVQRISESSQQSWTIQAKLKRGVPPENIIINMEPTISVPVFILDSDVMSSDNFVIAVIFHTPNYQIAQQICEQLLTTGLVKDIKITN